MKKSVADLAVFGGPPLFKSPRPIGQLHTPDIDDYLKTLKGAFDERHLTNDGKLVTELENKLAVFHGTSHCVVLANAGLGIMMLMQLFSQGRRGEVIMPAFSYRGLPHFAQWAGQMPCFCDVDPRTHTLNPESVEFAINERTTSILGVCNFNHPGDIEGLEHVAKRHNLPIFLDSVYAIGSTHKEKILGSFTNAEVYSLHATKLLNGFEGGYITTNHDDLAKKLRWQRNFALPGLVPQIENTDHIIGVNAKLNEMHAALALLSLDEIDNIIDNNLIRFSAYQTGINKINGLSLIPYAEGERVNYQMAVLEIGDHWPLTREQTMKVLRAEGAAISGYYSPALHHSEHCPPGLKMPKLPVSEALAKKYLQLPVGELTSEEDIHKICQLLNFVGEAGVEVEKRLSQEN